MSHHADVVTSREVVHDLSIPQFKPVDMLHLKMFFRRLDSHEHAAVHRKLSHPKMRAANLTLHNYRVSFGNHILDFDMPVRKRGVNVYEYSSEFLVPCRTTEILGVLCEIQERRLNVAPVKAFEKVTDYAFIPLRVVGCLTSG